jgi:hypothetical protein
MLMKRKSVAVVVISGFIISLVLVLTLVAYVVYIEIKSEEFRSSYSHLLHKIRSSSYSRYIEVSKLSAGVEKSGPLKNQAVLEGNVTNKGVRAVSDLVVKVRFLDNGSAAIYEVIFRPQEPSLGVASLTQSAFSRFVPHAALALKPGETLAFKKVLAGCPKGIFSELDKTSGFAKKPAGKLDNYSSEIISLEFF